MESDGELDIMEHAERTAFEENCDDDNGEPVEVEREVNGDDVEADEDEETTRRVIKPKRVVRNPQPKLNADTLRGSRGLTALQPLFAKQKFKGKGHEETDLNIMLKSYEYWCHRLFPKIRFDQCIEKIETLGNKKQVQTYIKRIRMGILDEERPEPQTNIVSDDETETTATRQQQQIESLEARFDSFAQRPQETQLTEEQKETIRLNRERAMNLRAERLRRIQEQAESKLGTSSVLLLSSQFEESHVIDSMQSQDEITNSIREFHEKTTQEVTDVVRSTGKGAIQSADEFDNDGVFMTPISQIPNTSSQKLLQNTSEAAHKGEVAVDDILNNLQGSTITKLNVGNNHPNSEEEMEIECAENESGLNIDEMLSDLKEKL